MASTFDISTLDWRKGGVLLSLNGAVVVPIVLDEECRALDDYTSGILRAGTPVAKIASGTTYKPVRRDTITSVTYSTATTNTVIVLDTDADPFVLGDTCQAFTTVDEAGADCGDITAIDYSTNTLTFAGDQSGDASANDYLEVTETSVRDANGEPGALILIATVDCYNAPQRAVVDTPAAGLITGVIQGGALLGPLSNSDAQLVADITGYIIPWVA